MIDPAILDDVEVLGGRAVVDIERVDRPATVTKVFPVPSYGSRMRLRLPEIVPAD